MSTFCQTIRKAKLTLSLLAAGVLLLWGCNHAIRMRRPPPELAEGAPPLCTASVGQPDLACAAPPSTFATADLSTNCQSVPGCVLGKRGMPGPGARLPRSTGRRWPPAMPANYPSGFVRGVPDTCQGVRHRAVHRRLRLGDVQGKTGALQCDRAAGGVAATDLRPEVRAGILRRPDPDVRQRRCHETGAGKKAAARFCPNQQDPHGRHHRQHRRRNGGGGVARAGKHRRPLRRFHQPRPGRPATSARKRSTRRRFPARPPSLTPRPAPMADNPVGPRVFKGTPAQDHFLYYEVKVNYDYYAYVAGQSPSTVRRPASIPMPAPWIRRRRTSSSCPFAPAPRRPPGQEPCGAGL